MSFGRNQGFKAEAGGGPLGGGGTAHVLITANAGQAFTTLDALQARIAKLPFNRVAQETNRWSEALGKLGFRLSFVGFIIQFISLMTLMMMSRIAMAIKGVIETVADWRESMIKVALGATVVAGALGDAGLEAGGWADALERSMVVGKEAEGVMNLLNATVARLQTAFVGGLFEGLSSEKLQEFNNLLVPLEETLRQMGVAMQPVIDTVMELMAFFASEDGRQGLVLLTELIAEFLRGIAEGLPILTFIITLLNESGLLGVVKALARSMGQLLISFIFFGTALSLSGPLFNFISLMGQIIGRIQNILLVLTGGNGLIKTLQTFFALSRTEAVNSIGLQRIELTKLGKAFEFVKTNALGGLSGITKFFQSGLGKAVGVAGLAALGGGLLATGGLEGLQSAFDSSKTATMEQKLKGLGAVASFAGAAFVAFPSKITAILAIFIVATFAILIFKEELMNVGKVIIDFFANDVTKWVIERWTEVVDFFNEHFGRSTVPDAIEKGMNEAESIMGSSLSNIRSLVSSDLDKIASEFIGFKDTVTKAMVGTGDSLISATGQARDTLTGAAGSLKSSIDSLTAHINQPRVLAEAQGFKQGLVGEKAKDIANNIRMLQDRVRSTESEFPNPIAGRTGRLERSEIAASNQHSLRVQHEYRVRQEAVNEEMRRFEEVIGASFDTYKRALDIAEREGLPLELVSPALATRLGIQHGNISTGTSAFDPSQFFPTDLSKADLQTQLADVIARGRAGELTGADLTNAINDLTLSLNNKAREAEFESINIATGGIGAKRVIVTDPASGRQVIVGTAIGSATKEQQDRSAAGAIASRTGESVAQVQARMKADQGTRISKKSSQRMQSGGIIRIGEAGPELLVIPHSSRITKGFSGGSSMGNTSITVNLPNVTIIRDEEDAKMIARMLVNDLRRRDRGFLVTS